MRAEYIGQKIQTGSQADIDSINNKIKFADERLKEAKATTALIVDKQLVRDKIDTQNDSKGNLFLNINELSSWGVTYAVYPKYVQFSFKDVLSQEHSFNVDIALINNQPWTDKGSNNVFPAIKKVENQYYVAQNILSQCFGFDVTFDKQSNCINVTTDNANISKNAVLSAYTVDSKNVISLATATKLNVLDSNGVLKDDAIKTYEASIKSVAPSTPKKSSSSSGKSSSSTSNTNNIAPQPTGFKGSAFSNSS